jgi:hypothetical protein
MSERFSGRCPGCGKDASFGKQGVGQEVADIAEFLGGFAVPWKTLPKMMKVYANTKLPEVRLGACEHCGTLAAPCAGCGTLNHLATNIYDRFTQPATCSECSQRFTVYK